MYFDYDLPTSAIAQEPLEKREEARLLRVHRFTGKIEHHHFWEVPGLLNPGDLLVLNNTRVSALRLKGQKSATGGAVEALLLKPLAGERRFLALMRPAKRLRQGTQFTFEQGLEAVALANLRNGHIELEFEPTANFEEKLVAAGSIPLPPYIRKKIKDPERYQTVYARQAGSAAAPTAGLHFTPHILEQIQSKGIELAWVALDVGLDTFRAIQGDPKEHAIHGERCVLPERTAEAVERCQGRVLAVGTTAVRTLESFAISQRKVRPGEMESRLFIQPGHCFRVVDGMFTNFHMPRTTMLLMIAAMAGETTIQRAYQEAIEKKYRFLSFGDAMLIL